ncbi:MAG: hypothetical protein NZ561_12340, partial [Phycisphaerae bacterium]|nr:hypothetical protein [Phycisphaerae bacterium]MDW8261455.1 hypothetical protein [Phycisphaerales bacterium]
MHWPLLLLLTFAVEPVRAPAAAADSPVRQWLAELASEEAAVREEARRNMLGMSRQQLLELRQLVAAGEARLPAQQAALAEIVRHVYLATEPYPPAPGDDRSFIGLSGWRLLDTGRYTGVTFERRLPGFDAYRALEDGDVILGVEELP